MTQWTKRSPGLRRFGLALAAASVVVVLSPLPDARSAPTPTGSIAGTVFPGSAVRGAGAETFALGVSAADLSSAQTIKSVLVTLPGSGWTLSGPAVGTTNGAGWTVRSVTATSVCWGSATALTTAAPVGLSITAATSAPLGTATWTAKAYGDSTCRLDVKPSLAAPTANVYVAIAQTGGHCGPTSSCRTERVSGANPNSSLEVVGTGTSDAPSFVSAAVLEELPTGFDALTCPKLPSYDPDIGETSQTLVSGGARTHTVRRTMAKELVNLVSDNGAARMDVCLRSEQPFATKYGGSATPVGPFQLAGTGKLVTMYDGFVPRCGVPAQAPCITDQYKRNGDMVWEIVLPAGDPYYRP